MNDFNITEGGHCISYKICSESIKDSPFATGRNYQAKEIKESLASLECLRHKVSRTFLTPKEEEELYKVIDEYKVMMPFLKDKSLEEWSINAIGFQPERGTLLADLHKISQMKDFLQSNLINGVVIHKNKPADETLLGSSCRVYEADLESGKNVVAKVMNKNNLSYISQALEQAVHIKIAGILGVGPKFHGFYITDDEKIAILMDKINGHGLNPERNDFWGKQFINIKTLNSFKTKMERLHQAGYTFDGNEVQKLIGVDGIIYFIDIWLIKLQNGMCEIGSKKINPQDSKWYKDNLALLYTNLKV